MFNFNLSKSFLVALFGLLKTTTHMIFFLHDSNKIIKNIEMKPIVINYN